MKEIVKYGLMGAAAFFAWRNFSPVIADALGLGDEPDPEPSPETEDEPVPQPPPPPQPRPDPVYEAPIYRPPLPLAPPREFPPFAVGVLRQAAKQRYSEESLLTFDQWNWFYEQDAGRPGPAWEDAQAVYPTGPRDIPIRFESWGKAVTRLGLRGLGGLRCGSSRVAAPGFLRVQQ